MQSTIPLLPHLQPRRKVQLSCILQAESLGKDTWVQHTWMGGKLSSLDYFCWNAVCGDWISQGVSGSRPSPVLVQGDEKRPPGQETQHAIAQPLQPRAHHSEAGKEDKGVPVTTQPGTTGQSPGQNSNAVPMFHGVNILKSGTRNGTWETFCWTQDFN